MATASLTAQARAERGTGVARKLRQAGQVPAVIYGHGREPQSLAINTREVEKLLGQFSAGSTVIELSVDGAVSKTLIREIQRHPVNRSIVHIDFQQLVAGEKITVSIPLRFVGTADGVRNSGGILEETMHEVHLRVDPSSIPDHIDVDVTPLTIGHSYHVSDLVLPAGVTILDDAGATVCVCTAPKAVVEEVPAVVAVEGVEAAVPAEPELIRKPKAEEEEETK
jgi:large subunit ribosomal protein L25